MTALPFVFDDGGRKAAGYKGTTGDCAVRAIAIATGIDYQDVYDLCAVEAKLRPGRGRKPAGPRTGMYADQVRRIMADLGWRWFPTMTIGSGTTVHLADGELPLGRLVVRLSRHFAAVVDGVVHDTYDDQRDGTRAVYGYWYNPKEYDPS